MYSALCWVMKAIWLIAIVMLINIGLNPFGYDLFQTDFMLITVPWLITPLHYLAGIAGLLGILKFIRALSGGKSWCGCDSGKACGCSHKMN